MSEISKSTSVKLISGSTALVITFTVLKAFGKLDWSWWAVFAPYWLPVTIIFGCFILYIIGLFLWMLIEHFLTKKKKRR